MFERNILEQPQSSLDEQEEESLARLMKTLEEMPRSSNDDRPDLSSVPTKDSLRSAAREGVEVAKELGGLVKEAIPPLVAPIVDGVKRVDQALQLEKPVVEVRGHEVSRRAFLGGGLATAVTGAVIGSSVQNILPEVRRAEAQRSHIPLEQNPDGQVKRESGPQVYDMGVLAGRGVGDLFCDYLNVAKGTKLPQRLKIDFEQANWRLWTRKAEVVGRKKPAWVENTKYGGAVYTQLYQSERETMSGMSLEDFITKTDSVIQDVNQSLNWEQLNKIEFNEEKFTHLTDSDVQLVKQLAERISGTMLLAFSITELMPALNDHKINVAMYRFLLKNAGTAFLRSIPALYDVYLSAGLFQFTSFAVYDVGEKDKRGASAINVLLPKEKRIKGSVVKLRTDEEQMKAAQLFAIRNLAYLIEGIRNPNLKTYDPKKTEARIQTLLNHAGSLDVAILQYISSAHHLPGDARTAFIKWVDRGFSGSHADLASAGIRNYIKKSHGGYQELERVLAAEHGRA